jgi:hypothetical protein
MRTKLMLGASMLTLLLFAGAGNAKQRLGPPMKIVLSPASNVASAEIIKNLDDKCPNVHLTLNSHESDFMLDARGWPEHYHFTLYQKGGTAVFATSTVMLSNAVKDVCKYLNNNPPPPPPPQK